MEDLVRSGLTASTPVESPASCRHDDPCEGIIEASEKQWARLTDVFARQDASLAEFMPTEADALFVLSRVHERLTKLGWQDVTYCPKDGSTFAAIEFGSTGVHECFYMGNWPKGSWWMPEAGDLWPSRPVMWRPQATTTEADIEPAGCGDDGCEGEAGANQKVPSTPLPEAVEAEAGSVK